MADDPTPKDEPKTLAERVAANPEWGKDIGEKKSAQAKAKEATERADTIQTALDELQGSQKAATEAAEKLKNEKSGDYETNLENQKTSMQGEIDDATKKGDGWKARVIKMVGKDALTTALGAAGVPSDRLGQAAQLLDNRVRVEFDADGKESVTVLDEDGSEMFVDGNAATLEDLAKDFTAKNAHFREPNNDNGSGFHPGGAGEVTWDSIKDSPKLKSAFITEHGNKAYQDLATAARRKKKVE